MGRVKQRFSMVLGSVKRTAVVVIVVVIVIVIVIVVVVVFTVTLCHKLDFGVVSETESFGSVVVTASIAAWGGRRSRCRSHMALNSVSIDTKVRCAVEMTPGDRSGFGGDGSSKKNKDLEHYFVNFSSYAFRSYYFSQPFKLMPRVFI